MNSKYKDQYNAGYEAGVKLACAEFGITPGEAVRVAAKADVLMSDPTMQNALCKVAATILAAGGEAMSEEHRLFCKMASYDAPFSAYTVKAYIEPVVKVLSKCAEARYEDAMNKSAAFMGTSLLAKLFGKTLSTGPEVAKLLAMLGAGAGVAGGGMAWALNRDSTQNEADVEAKEQQAKHFRRIAKDIQKQMNLKAEKPKTKKDKVRKAAEEMGESNYVL